jgi:hypothetical protein
MQVIVGAILTAVGVFTGYTPLITMGITMMVSGVVSKLLAPDVPNNPNPNLGVSNLQVQPATNNKLPVVYGNCYVGGTITDLSITTDNQNLYYVLSLCEVTNYGADTISFNSIFYGGRRAIFDGYTYTDTGKTVSSVSGQNIVLSGSIPSYITLGTGITFSNSGLQPIYYVSAINTSTNTISFSNSLPTTSIIGFEVYQFVDPITTTQVVALQDLSNNAIDTSINGYINIYLYNNGSNSSVNSGSSAISVMQASGLTYTWDSNKLMTNCAFAIVHLTYNTNANVTALEQTQFEITNSRNSAGDCLSDYLTNTVYGAGIPSSQIDTTSMTALNTYSNGLITYQDYLGNTQTQPRFKFNGLIDTSQTVLNNIQSMSNCCDCIVRYNEIYGQWGVIVQTPSYTVAMDINDSNMVSSLTITSLDISNTYNEAEAQYADIVTRSSFNTTILNLAVVNPSLLYPNEPINKQTIQLPLVNNNVQAQLLANRFLKSARLDLQVMCEVMFIGLELEAGDIVTVTNANYGWTAKLFRIMQVQQTFTATGEITVKLTLQVYDPANYNDVSITQYIPPIGTGLSSPNLFGTIPAPTIVSTNTYVSVPNIVLQVTTSSTGITQYAEVWYSSFSNPSSSQYIFAGTSQVQSVGTPWGNNVVLPNITLANIPSGNWYFFTRMINTVATSLFSSASVLVQWRPSTYQFSQRYLSVAYADNITGSGFSYSPTNKTYYGIVNESNSVVDPTISDYKWYPAPTPFGTTNYLLYNNYGNKLIGFSVGIANISAGGGAFVPSDTSTYDPSTWSGLPNGVNVIDLNFRTGQVIQTGTTSTGTGELAIINNPEGLLQASLAELLTFPGGATTYTSSVATITVDRYGRIIGFVAPDNFYYTMASHIATSGQTVFSITRGSEYLSGNSLVFQNGLLLDTTNWTDGSSQITLAIGANLDDVVTIISMASVSASTSTTYNSFTIYPISLSNQANYTASGWLVSGNELIFLNGTVVNSQDYNIIGQVISFNTAVSGDMQVIIWTNNNQSQPNGNPQNITLNTIIGQINYVFTYNPLSFNLYNNGVLLLETVDYSVTTGSYTLSQTPTSNLNLLLEQTFNRNGPV